MFLKATTHSGVPEDVLFMIFSLLDASHLLVCKQVCCQFLRLIESDLSLQYKIELAANGMIDTPRGGTTIADRLGKIRDYAGRLRRGMYSCVVDHLLDRSAGDVRWRRVCSASNGSLAYVVDKANGTRELLLYAPQSVCSGTSARQWTVPLGIFDRSATRYGVDAEQDLLVVAQYMQDNRDIRFLLLSLHNNGTSAHPRAAQSSILTSTAPANHAGDLPRFVLLSHLRVHGERIACILHIWGGGKTFLKLAIWNWKTGRLVWQKNFEDVVNLYFTVLDDMHIAVMTTSEFALEVYSLHPHSGDRPASPSPLCTLAFPAPTKNWGQLRVENIAYTLPSRPSQSDASVPPTSFQPNPQSAILVVTYATPIPLLNAYRNRILLIPSSTLFSAIDKAHSQSAPRGVTMGWSEWGHCSLLLNKGQSPDAHINATAVGTPYGSKLPILCHSANEDESSGRVLILDVDAWVAKSARHFAREDGGGDREGRALDLEAAPSGTGSAVTPNSWLEPMLASGSTLPHAVFWGPRVSLPDQAQPSDIIMGPSGFSILYRSTQRTGRGEALGFQSWAPV